METNTIQTRTINSQYCVVFRTGGTANFKWHRSLAMSKEEADNHYAEMIRGGYRCFVERYDRSMKLGFPETFGQTINGRD